MCIRDRVRKINNNLEKLLSMDLQTRICKPACQNQCDHDLRYKSDYPQNQRISTVFEHCLLYTSDMKIPDTEIDFAAKFTLV